MKYNLSLIVIFILSNVVYAERKHDSDIDAKPLVTTIIWVDGDKSPTTRALYLWEDISSAERQMFSPHKKINIEIENGIGVFNLTGLKRLAYFVIGNDSLELVPVGLKYFVNPGDSIIIQDNDGILKFSGRGAEKLECIKLLNSQTYTHLNSWLNDLDHNVWGVKKVVNKERTNQVDKFDIWINRNNLMISAKVYCLRQFKPMITEQDYEVIYANIIGGEKEMLQYSFYMSYGLSDSITRKKLLPVYSINRKEFEDLSIKPEIIIISDEYCKYLLSLFSTRYLLDRKNSIYHSIKNAYSGEARDKLLTIYLQDRYEYVPNLDSTLQDALNIVKSAPYKTVLEDLNDSVIKGRKAFDFSLPDVNGKMFSLHQFRGKVVFIDFWFTGCGGCMRYYQDHVSKAEEKFKDNPDVVFITISLDKDPNIWKTSIKGGKYTSPEILNLYTEGKGSNHEIIQQYKVSAAPRPLLIDKVGRIFSSSEEHLRYEQNLIKTIEEALKKH